MDYLKRSIKVTTGCITLYKILHAVLKPDLVHTTVFLWKFNHLTRLDNNYFIAKI